MTPQPPPKIFISYAHTDDPYRKELIQQLTPLISDGKISVWDDTHIKPGQIWRDEIKKALAEADMGVLLVSSAFLASEYIRDHELKDLLAKKHRIWFTVSACSYQFSLLEGIQSANIPEKPVDIFPKPRRAAEWVKITKAIMEELTNPP